MSAPEVLAQWEGTLHEILPDLHAHQRKALAALSLALVCARHCGENHIALHVLSPRGEVSHPQSAARRLQRFLSNPRLPVERCTEALCRDVLQQLCARPGGHLRLLLDETPLRNALRVLKLSVCDQGRSLPLLWVCYRPAALPHRQPVLVVRLLSRFAHLLASVCPAQAFPTVTLLADRGLAWPLLVDCCARWHWHFLLRLTGHVRVRRAGAEEVRLDTLALRPGCCWCGPAEVFKDAGWRAVQVVALWKRREEEPWLLITSWPATPQLTHWYRQRLWQEQSFRDEKSSGFQWQRSQVRSPEHATRLLLLLMVAQLWMTSLGHYLTARRQHLLLQRRGRKELSLFQRGLRFFEWAWMRLPIPTLLRFPPPRDRFHLHLLPAPS